MGRKIIHGHGLRGKKSKEYITWVHMKQRCFNSKHKRYADYGGRGITVCEGWLSFENFISDMGNSPSGKHTLERIDNDGIYEKSNCKWATMSEQSRNTRKIKKYRYKDNDELLCAADLAELYKMKLSTLRSRLMRGWSIDRALTEKLGHSRNPFIVR
jgi:hypothetical protein